MFWLILGHFASIFLSHNFSTTLEFPEPIEQVIYGGSKRDFFIYLSKNKKTLTVKPLDKNLNSNLTIITQEKNYNFWIKIDNEKPHVSIKIKEGRKDLSFKTVFENNALKIQEGETSTLIINKNKNPINVNGINVLSQSYFSKGIPFIVNNLRVFN